MWAHYRSSQSDFSIELLTSTRRRNLGLFRLEVGGSKIREFSQNATAIRRDSVCEADIGGQRNHDIHDIIGQTAPVEGGEAEACFRVQYVWQHDRAQPRSDLCAVRFGVACTTSQTTYVACICRNMPRQTMVISRA